MTVSAPDTTTTYTVVTESGLKKVYTINLVWTNNWTACSEAALAGQYYNAKTKQIYVPANSNITLADFYTAHSAESMTYDYNGSTGLTYLGSADANASVKVVDAANVSFTRTADGTWTVVSSMD